MNRTKSKTKKKWKYHTSHSFKHGNTEYSFITQLYQIGVYGIMNGRSDMQGNFTPNQIVSMEKRLRKDEEKGVISDLKFGNPITVTAQEDSGLYIEIRV